MTATDAQVRILMRERKKGKTQEQAAVAANLSSRKTVAKYEQVGRLPSQLKQPRTYRTRDNPFAQDWDTITEMLTDAPELEAKTLFNWLCDQHPERYHAGQLRTLQRHIRRWRALNKPQIATLDQLRPPGELMQLDGTSMNSLGITLQGQPFPHIFIHCVLPYSNWAWGKIAQSESFGAVHLGLQSTLEQLGYVPKAIQTDNSSAATKRMQIATGESKRTYTKQWQHLCDHYGLEPRSTHVGSPNENGDVEAGNGAFKRAVTQNLLLRGSTEFESIDAYEQFLAEILEKRNMRQTQRLQEEITKMRPLQVGRIGNKRLRVRVNSASLIRVQSKSYSVPTSLIGHHVDVYCYEWHIDLYYAGQFIESMPRLIGEASHHVNYRHLIVTLLRKPGGFRRYRYRDALFPQQVFRRAWEQLNKWHSSHKADLTYLRVLHLAATEVEQDVSMALELLLESGDRWTEQTVADLIKGKPEQQNVVVAMSPFEIDLAPLDQLLGEESYGVS